MLGVILATIGIDSATGMPRYTWGNISLLSGIQLVPFVIGAFGFAQVMQLIYEKNTDVSELKQRKLRFRDSIITKKAAKECAPTIARSGVIGTIVGILPGSGATISAFLCYIMNKRISKRGNEFGTGIPVLLKLISVPSRLISPVVVVLCFIGAFAASNKMINVYIMIAATVLGYFMAKYKYPTSNMLLAFVLTPTIEKNFYRSLMVNNGSFSLYWTKPIIVAFLLITAALMVAPTIMKKVRKNKPAAAAQAESEE